MEAIWEARFQALEAKYDQRILQLQSQLETVSKNKDKLHSQCIQLAETVETLRQFVDFKEDKQESFFQKYLEKKFNASHTKNKFGTTDIETDDAIIEIKNWKNYKGAVGQIISYTHGVNKRKVVYLFGKKPKNIKDVINLFRSHHIDMYHLEIDALGCVNEENMHECKDDFYQWCRLNIKSCDNGILKLTDVVKKYTNTSKEWHSKELSKYKVVLEALIKDYFKISRWQHSVVTIDNKQYRGWKGVCMV